MPGYAVLVYVAFFGGFAMMSWNHLRSGKPAGGLWRKYAAAILINIFLFETPAVSIFHIYTYYGHQPFDFWGFPLWWPFVNTLGPITAGALVHVLGTLSEIGGPHVVRGDRHRRPHDRWTGERCHCLSDLDRPQLGLTGLAHLMRGRRHHGACHAGHARSHPCAGSCRTT
jgi:hypothetical protein